MDEKETMTALEAAAVLGLSRITVHSLIRRGHLIAEKDETRTYRIDAESVRNRKPGKAGRPRQKRRYTVKDKTTEQPE